ncbi:MAG TPA: DUF2892 domain-containing protein [Candidatus Aminicenantes bacterium]|nr:DUF2892 domain-containing protein [Candidatus Aminicenantes bacterium]
MKKNMGVIDRMIRTILALVVVLLLVTKTLTGTLAIALGVIAVVFLLTSLVSFCPLYTLLGMRTNKK